VLSTLTPAAQHLGAASTSTSAIVPEIDKLKTDLATVLKGGQPGPLIAMADQIRQALVRTGRSLEIARQRTDQTITEVRQIGNSPPGTAAPPE
jgi:pyrroline-5-carboxylate reductase